MGTQTIFVIRLNARKTLRKKMQAEAEQVPDELSGIPLSTTSLQFRSGVRTLGVTVGHIIPKLTVKQLSLIKWTDFVRLTRAERNSDCSE